MNGKKGVERNRKLAEEEEADLTADADGSSAGKTVAARFNDDNDRITGHPDGESDDSDFEPGTTFSTLEDK